MVGMATDNDVASREAINERTMRDPNAALKRQVGRNSWLCSLSGSVFVSPSCFSMSTDTDSREGVAEQNNQGRRLLFAKLALHVPHIMAKL